MGVRLEPRAFRPRAPGQPFEHIAFANPFRLTLVAGDDIWSRDRGLVIAGTSIKEAMTCNNGVLTKIPLGSRIASTGIREQDVVGAEMERQSYPRRKGEKQMAPSTKDQIEGNLHEIKGKVKEKVGQATGNPNLEAEGQGENLVGKVQKKVGQIEKVLEK
jgi:uncharacterized protein YjbJ (UPF0337 family)